MKKFILLKIEGKREKGKVIFFITFAYFLVVTSLHDLLKEKLSLTPIMLLTEIIFFILLLIIYGLSLSSMCSVQE